MAPLTCQRLESMAELALPRWAGRALATHAAALPTSLAELVAQWVEHFAALAIGRGGGPRRRTAVAALPLTVGGPPGFSVGRLPGNAWTTAGELLLDPGCDVAAARDSWCAGWSTCGCR